MDILYLLIPLSAVLVLAILAVFAWALHSGQFDDLEQHAEQILAADDAGLTGIKPVERAPSKNLPIVSSAEEGGFDGCERASCSAGELHR